MSGQNNSLEAIDCNGLSVSGLEQVFPTYQSESEFQIEELVYKFHSVWSNDADIRIYWTDLWSDEGIWVITNGTYTMYNDNETQSYSDTPGPRNGSANYDHFPNDNPLAISDGVYSLDFFCYETFFPTSLPTSTPTNVPTVDCVGIDLEVTDIDCASTGVLSDPDVFDGLFNRQSTLINDNYWWKSGDSVLIYYNEAFDKWVIGQSPDNVGFVVVEDDSSYGMYPENDAMYLVVDSDNLFSSGCQVNVSYTCYGMY